MVIFYYRGLKEKDNASYAEAIKYRVEKLGIMAKGIDEAVSSAYNVCGSDMLLSDFGGENTETFLKNQKYVLIVVTPGLLQDLTALFELDAMHRLFAEGSVKIFSIFKNIAPYEMPERMCWIRQTKYIQPKGVPDIYNASVKIAAEYWKDRLGDSECVTVEGYLRDKDFYRDGFLREISKIYRELESHDVRSKVLVLIIVNHYMVIKKDELKEFTEHQECIRGLAEFIYQGRMMTQDELAIINNCILDMLQNSKIVI